mmetsp:Transcript_33962/g.80093  ORF Transcript_33962/g.80093 Transcript_33962/m.80093 type:complete len:224 (-) Transcript_33962:140-811(-)
MPRLPNKPGFTSVPGLRAELPCRAQDGAEAHGEHDLQPGGAGAVGGAVQGGTHDAGGGGGAWHGQRRDDHVRAGERADAGHGAGRRRAAARDGRAPRLQARRRRPLDGAPPHAAPGAPGLHAHHPPPRRPLGHHRQRGREPAPPGAHAEGRGHANTQHALRVRQPAGGARLQLAFQALARGEGLPTGPHAPRRRHGRCGHPGPTALRLWRQRVSCRLATRMRG